MLSFLDRLTYKNLSSDGEKLERLEMLFNFKRFKSSLKTHLFD